MNDEVDNVRTLRRVVGGQAPKECYIESLEKIVAAARSGEVTAFAFVAIGPDFGNWMMATPMTRQDRMNLIGQLQTIVADLTRAEIDSWG